jgi:hypothetical protein
LFAFGALGLTTVVISDNESHHTSAKYLAWKYLAVGDWQYGSRFLNVGVEFRRSFEGKPRATLLRWFPDLRPATRPENLTPDLRVERIGDTPWLVVYDQRGLIKDFLLPTG